MDLSTRIQKYLPSSETGVSYSELWAKYKQFVSELQNEMEECNKKYIETKDEIHKSHREDKFTEMMIYKNRLAELRKLRSVN